MPRFCNNVNGTGPKLWLRLFTASYGAAKLDSTIGTQTGREWENEKAAFHL
jgi:hypothetical protein